MFKYLRKSELCEKLSISRSTLERYVAAGLLPKPYSLDKRAIAWRLDEIEEYLNSLSHIDDAYSCRNNYINKRNGKND